jgi:hypothetical protein
MTTPLPDIYHRDDFPIALAFKDAAGAAIDISSWEFVTTLKPATLPLDLTDATAVAPTGARRFDTAPSGGQSALGLITLTLTGGAAGNTDITPNTYVLTVRRLIAGASPWVVLQRYIRVLPTGAEKLTA